MNSQLIRINAGVEFTKIYFQIGAEGSTLRWWDSKKIRTVSTTIGAGEDGKTDYSSHAVNILVSDEEDAEIIYEKDLRLPHLVNVGKLHSPHNPTNEKRFVDRILNKLSKNLFN